MLVSRRRVLLNTALAGLAPAAVLAACKRTQPAPGPAPGPSGTPPGPGGSLFVRKDVATLSQTGPEMTAYRNGVAAMMARPATDPTSWMFWANTHGTYDSVPSNLMDVWRTCQHGNWHFLSWHRIYLYYFERVLRAASGDPTFALPYWNYEAASARAMPAAFRQPTTGNPLYIAARNDGSGGDPDTSVNINAGGQLPASVVDTSQAMGQSGFGSAVGFPPGFTGNLEQQPHNIIHVVIGGDGLMSDPGTAARDPIFWLHHANIDRLWNRWIAAGGHADPTDSDWLNHQWTFYDENKQKVTMTGAQVLQTASQLGYRYDDDPPGGLVVAAAAAAPPTEGAARPPRPVASAPGVALSRTQGASVTLKTGATESGRVLGAEGGPPTYLVLEGFDYAGRQSTWYQVYANLPAGTKPDPKGPYFVGNLALFALNRGEHAGHGETSAAPAKVVFDLGAALARQRREGVWKGGDVKVTMVPRGPASRAEAARPAPKIGSIRIVQ